MVAVMEERVILIEGRIVQITDELERITGQLAGDGSDLAPGVVGILGTHTATLSDHGVRIARLERTVDRFRWTLTGAATIGSLIGGALVAFLTNSGVRFPP